VKPILRHGLARLRRDRARTVLTAGGIVAAAAMIGAAATLVFALSTAFDRTAARAGLADIAARFGQEPLSLVQPRVDALPNVRAVSFRYEANGVGMQAGANFADGTVVGVPTGGPHGYAVVSGHDVTAPGQLVVEQGLARSWHLHAGDSVTLSGPTESLTGRVVGVAIAPDSVAYPLIRSPRVFGSIDDARRLTGAGNVVDAALIWVNDRSQLDVTLAQARAASFGVSDLRFATRSGYARLIGRAAGLVIALLVAFSLIALAAAGVMLAASAAAEVQRRRQAIGVLRALGAAPADVGSGYALETAAVAGPAAAVGLVVGWLAVDRPTRRLLGVLNELAPPTLSSAAVLVGCWLAVVGLIAAATWLPAWRTASLPTVDSLRQADVVPTPRRLPLAALAGLGARIALARPLRAATLVAVLAASSAVILLILTIANVLRGLEQNAQTLGTRYQLTVPGYQASLARVRSVGGVVDATRRYETDAADSFDLGESFRLIAFSGDGTRFEAPPLDAGRRVRADDETDVGLGLAQALDLHVGGTLAAQLPSGREVRFRVVGILDALRNEGLLAYVRPRRLVAAMPDVQWDVAVKLSPGANLDFVRNVLLSRGIDSERTGGISQDAGTSGSVGRTSFLRILAALLRSVAFLDGLVCVYALAQMLALIARERRRAVAVVRALGASRTQVLAVFAGSALVIAAIAAPLGIVAQRFVLGPLVARLAVSYVTLSLGAGSEPIAFVLAGVAVAVVGAAAWATRSATADAIVVPLREE
jgi:ABC-type antimicrobial peptide transport system permease subunit